MKPNFHWVKYPCAFQVSSDLSISILHSNPQDVLESNLHVVNVTFTVSQHQKHRKLWKLKRDGVTLWTSFLFILNYSEKYFNLCLYKMLSATCCKTTPFIFPVKPIKHCFKTNKRKRNTISSVTSPLTFCYVTTLELRCIKKKEIIVLSRHQGGLAQRSSKGIQHNSQDMSISLK